jgi:hypothetical protein
VMAMANTKRIRLGAQRNHTKNYLCAKPENTRKLEYSLSQTMSFFIAYAAYPTVNTSQGMYDKIIIWYLPR